MKNQYDVFIDGDTALVFNRGEIPECGLIPDARPLLRCLGGNEDWVDYCGERTDWRDRRAVRVLKRVGSYPADFKDDVLARAKRLWAEYREEGKRLGWGDLAINYNGMTQTYRRSAAWKDEPTYFTFDQSLKWTEKNENIDYNGCALRVRDCLVMLWGMSTALYELGLNLVFDEDLNLHLFGNTPEWKAEYQ